MRMLRFAGSDTGNTYIKESKISLLSCTHYNLTEDNNVVGSFLSGCRHSGDKYCRISLGGENLTVQLILKTFLKSKYQISDTASSKPIGYLEYSSWNWLNSERMKIILTNGETYQFKENFRLTNLWRTRKRIAIGSDTIQYSVEFNADELYNISATGVIEMHDNNQILPAIIGLFFIDRKFRKWVQRNID